MTDADRAVGKNPTTDRDPYADVLRVLAILLVVLGHWLVAAVLVRDGGWEVNRVLALLPWTQWATWLFQVMPVFFIVGGFVNAGSWSRARARGEPADAWVRRRAVRLLVPLVPLVLAWLLIVPLLLLAGAPPAGVQLVAHAAFLPIWFLGTYLLIVIAVPFTWRLHRQYGLGALAAFVAAAAAVDALARAGIPLVAFTNSALVWAGIHQLGYFWRDGRLPRRPTVGLAFAALGVGVLLVLATLGGYPVSMVAVEAGERSNASPPTVALFPLALAQLGVLIAARGPVLRALAHPRVRAPVVLTGGATLTIFLWHLPALILVAGLTHLTGLWPPGDRIDARWWATRPLWVALCALALAPLVLLFRRFERPRAPAPPPPRWRTLAGLAAVLPAIAVIVRRGLYMPEAPWIPLAAVALLLAGLASLRALPPPPTRERSPRGDGLTPRA